MIRSVITIAMMCYCALLFSQQTTFTRELDTRRKHVPLQIVNNHPDYFYVLRYNKDAHDLTVERRKKPSGEIAAFTPLKLDSVNAHGFDYEKLAYRFFEKNGRAYFAFEKTLNTKKAVYLKIIDTAGNASGFIELGTLDPEKNVVDFDFEFSPAAGNTLLVVGSQDYMNQTSKKIALLYDLERHEKIWVKKLPLENVYTGFSRGYTTNAENDLFYALVRSEVSGYKRQFINQVQVQVPVFFHDSLWLVCLPDKDPGLYKKPLGIGGLSGLNSIFIQPGEAQVTVLAHYTRLDEEQENAHFLMAQAFNPHLSAPVYTSITHLKQALTEQLTFYDGTDYKSAADKQYTRLETISSDGYAYYLAGRSEINFYKEMLLWKINLRTGVVASQEIVPRKIFYFDDRIRFRNIGTTAEQAWHGNFYTLVLENAANLEKNANDFKYRRFSRQKYLAGGNLVAYILRASGAFEKKLVYENHAYHYVPLTYSSNQNDFVFYLNNGATEKFAILKLDGF